MPNPIKNLIDSWPIVIFIITLLTTLVLTFFDKRVQVIADERIATSMPVSMPYLKLRNRVLNLENNSTNHDDDIQELKNTINRVEGKLDSLLLIMSTP